MTTREEKQRLRAILKPRIRQLTANEVAEKSRAIIRRIEELPAFRQAHTVMLFYPIQNEPDLRPLLERYRREKTLLLPVAREQVIEMRPYEGMDRMKAGGFGIMEPMGEAYTDEPDLIIIPGMAFDRLLHRMGRGAGYYDRFLPKYPGAYKVAVAYDLQVVEHVPTDAFDIRMDAVVTESAWLTE